MKDFITNEEIEATPSFKKMDKMFQTLVLKLANKKNYHAWYY